MKKIYIFLAMLLSVTLLASCSKKPVLKLYMPNDYIDKSLIKEFNKEFGVKVKLITFDSNEVALGQIRANEYDVAVPSDYAIEELAKDGLIEKINYKEYVDESFELADSLESFINQLEEEGFNFLDYAIPYFWGSLGILYNPNKVTEARLQTEGFGVIGDSNLETILYDSSRDAVMLAMLKNGKEIHDKERSLEELNTDLTNAEEWLKSIVKKGSKTSILSDQILTDMLSGTRYDAVVSYSGDAAYIMTENENYKFYNPNNTNVFADGFVILKNSENKELAKEFIKFMTSKEAALANTIEVGYTSARKDVYLEMVSVGGDYHEDRLKYAYEANLENFQIFRHDQALKTKIDEVWARVLSSQGS